MEWIIGKVVAPIVVIGVLVFIHELGHFLFAKWCGVGVIKFSIGFGPALFKFRFRETTYQLSLIPLGGYVRMLGDMPDMLTGAQATDKVVRDSNESAPVDSEKIGGELNQALVDRSRWFIEKGFWPRFAIVFAGPLFNFILAFVLVFFAVLFYGEEVRINEPVIGAVLEGGPAEKAGISEGDLVLSIDGKDIKSWISLAEMIHNGSGGEIDLRLIRDSSELNLRIQPQKTEIRHFTGEVSSAYRIGIGQASARHPVGVGQSLGFAGLWTADKTLLTYWGLWGMVSGKLSADDLAGPIFIIDAAGKQAEKGFDSLLYFTALLSVSLAVLNLLPIPILDGGHLMFFIWEATMGPISIRKKEFAQSLGMLLLLGLMVFAVRNDLIRDTSKLEQKIEWQVVEEEGEDAGLGNNEQGPSTEIAQ